MKIRLFILPSILFCLAATFLFYGSDISFQWEYFNWKPFLKILAAMAFTTFGVVGGLWYDQRKRNKSSDKKADSAL